MVKLAQVSLLVAGMALTTAAAPLVPPAHPLLAVMPLAIIEGGTVTTLPKSVKARRGKVVTLRGRADRIAPAATTAPARKQAAPRATRELPARDCACTSSSAGAGGGSLSEVADARPAENGLRVLILGPDGLARTRYVAAPPGVNPRQYQDD